MGDKYVGLECQVAQGMFATEWAVLIGSKVSVFADKELIYLPEEPPAETNQLVKAYLQVSVMEEYPSMMVVVLPQTPITNHGVVLDVQRTAVVPWPIQQ